MDRRHTRAPPHPAVEVVLVDDHRMLAEALARCLADEPDVTVLAVVHDLLLAADEVRRRSPQVVLVGHHVPGSTGVEVAREVKAAAPGAAVILVSGWTDDRVLVAAMAAGCSGFLTTRQPLPDLVAAVHAAAAGEALVAPSQLARLVASWRPDRHVVGADLTRREREVLVLLARGRPTAELATLLHLSVNTVRHHVQSILVKLGAHSKLEAVSVALREGVIDHPAQG